MRRRSRISSRIWAYVEIDATGEEGIIAAFVPALGAMMPLVATHEDGLRGMDDLAARHAQVSGKRVELRLWYQKPNVLRRFLP